MRVPLRIDSRNVVLPASLSKRINRKAAKLERVFDRIISCRVTIDRPSGSPRKGGQYNVRLEVSVPRNQIVVSRHHAENLAVAIREAFEATQRKLEEHSRKRRNDVKRHEEVPQGKVTQLFSDDGYGFILDDEGREIYFHRNSVLESGFDKLHTGSRVRFAEEQGHNGPQASTVFILD
jgi:ribosomal subunit interface protein